MEVLSQAPQPTIQCYHSIKNGAAVKELYQEFSPSSSYVSGKNLQSYNFENSLENFGGSFSFTVKEDIVSSSLDATFMDLVAPLDIIVISESGSEEKVSFIGVVTTISIGGIASNLTKNVTVSGKSIEYLFTYYNINADVKGCIFQTKQANTIFKTDLADKDGTKGVSIKDIVLSSFDMFKRQTVERYQDADTKQEVLGASDVSNYVIGDLIDLWYGSDFVEATNEKFLYPISSNLFSGGRINVIDYLKRLLPNPIYEIFGFINEEGKPKLCVRQVPFDNPSANYYIRPVLLSDFTLTKTCDEVYTAFMAYIEGSSKAADFYMELKVAETETEKGYNETTKNPEKVKIYGYQLLTCNFIGFNVSPENGEQSIDNQKYADLENKLQRWFGNLDDYYNGDFTLVNMTNEKCAKIGEWVYFAEGQFYVTSASHSWNFGDNPMINYQVSRGGKYSEGSFKPLKNLSAVYREFE